MERNFDLVLEFSSTKDGARNIQSRTIFSSFSMCLANREQESTDSGDQPVRVGPGAGRDFGIFFGLGPVRSEIFQILDRPVLVRGSLDAT